MRLPRFISTRDTANLATMKIKHPFFLPLAHLLLLGSVIWPAMARAVEQEKGVILKITDSGKGGNVVPQPLGQDPKRVVEELNARGVTEVRVQVNNAVPMSAVTEAGSKATDTLARLGFKGKIILDNKQWHLEKPESQQECVTAMHETYEKMDAIGRASVAGFSFGETTAGEESWKDYAKGVAETVRKLGHAFRAGRSDQGLRGKKFYVGGASFGGSFRELKPSEHETIKRAIDSVGGTLIYAYKSFHSRKGLPQASDADLANKANAKRFLLEVAGLANLAKVASQTEVQYRGNAGDVITDNAEFRAALIEVFNEHPKFLHVGAELVINNHDEKTKGALFDESGEPSAKVWRSLDSFADAIQKKRNAVGR